MLLVGTDAELLDLDAGSRLATGGVTALAGPVSPEDETVTALIQRRRVVQINGPDGPEARLLGELDAAEGQSLAVLPGGGDVVVGLRGARLVRLVTSGWERLEGIEQVPGRDGWKNPVGPAPDARSLAVSGNGRLWANVHVGGVWGSDDGGVTWRAAVEPRADVHEVVADTEGTVVVAAAVGFGWSTDVGETWSWTTDGLHASYSRAVALDGDSVLVSASTGPSTPRAAVYRGRLGEPFERCESGLPEWFDANIDTFSLSLLGGRAAIGTTGGTVYASGDGGRTWDVAAKGLDPVRAVQLR